MKVAIHDRDHCWEWQGARQPTGYGAAWDGSKVVSAHRLAWRLIYGAYPADFVCHRCDNPPCVRPDHLWLGTNADNMADMMGKHRSSAGRPRPTAQGNNHWMRRRGREMSGEDNPFSILNETTVRYIKSQKGIKAGNEIARDLGLKYSTVHKILSGINWSHIKVEDPSVTVEVQHHEDTNDR